MLESYRQKAFFTDRYKSWFLLSGEAEALDGLFRSFSFGYEKGQNKRVRLMAKHQASYCRYSAAILYRLLLYLNTAVAINLACLSWFLCPQSFLCCHSGLSLRSLLTFYSHLTTEYFYAMALSCHSAAIMVGGSAP